MRHLVAALLALWLCWSGAAWGQGLGSFLSPGELASDHADLDGITQCGQCHAGGQGVDPARCMACHDTVKAQVDSGKGFHSTLGARCATCHPDHKGRAAPLIKLSESTFDHDPTGFALRGAHATTACADCHVTPGKWTGLDPACASCHLDDEPHGSGVSTRALLARCASCHTDVNWDALPLPAAVFDHQSARDADFPLEGAHREVDCVACHVDLKFVPVAHDQCLDCHTNPHLAKLSSTCTDCHGMVDWRVKRFDHGLARFHLEGRHLDVPCASCHGVKVVKAIAHDACVRCHVDPHRAQFAPRVCEDCHTVQVAGFALPDFDHDATPFPLHGQHRDVGCAECHGTGPDATFVGVAHAGCEDCHADPHAGAFSPTPCANCHTEAGWRVEDFDHGRTAFPLTGRHADVACESCHVDRDWHPASASCADCHTDAPHEDDLRDACATCHTSAGWETLTFDHATGTGFALEGAHASQTCADCHGGPERFTGLQSGCPDCHLADRPPGHYPGACADCHSEVAWPDVAVDALDHDVTGFPLRGSHDRLPCAACHPTAPPWGLASSGCTDCHAADDPHRGLVGNTCEDCHTPVAWFRTRWRHTQTGWPLRGAHRLAACEDCHATGYAVVPTECWRCHEAEAPRSVAAHQSAAFPMCDSCHNPYSWVVTDFPH